MIGLQVGLGLLLLSGLLARLGCRLPGWLALLVGLLVVAGYGGRSLEGLDGPEPSGRPELVEDRAGLLEEAQRRHLAEYHALLAADHAIDYRVVTGRELGDLDRFAVAYVEARQMTEFFAAGRVADGILASTELIVAQAQQAEGERLPAIAGSGGAGARLPARLDAGRVAPSDDRVAVEVGAAPREVLAAYHRAMAARNDSPKLEIYSRATRDMLADWVVTPAQMDNMARSLANCPVARELTDDTGRRAVLRAPLAERGCPPYFLVREADAWRLDLVAMRRSVRFGRDNSWRLEAEALGPYRFGFAGLVFDSRGYPRSP